MATITKALRDLVTERAKGLREYCQTAQAIGIEMEIDHIIPESGGGKTTAGNLCLACASCNNFKRDAESAFDPESQQIVPLFNPRTQIWEDHFQWGDNSTRLMGLSPTGRATIERLKINRDIAVRARKLWVKAGWHLPIA